MVRAKTTFVIGAGASVPYGMPLGIKLLERLRTLNNTPEVRDVITGALNPVDVAQVQKRQEELSQFVHAAQHYRGRSIDTLLQHQPRYRELGHRVIAALMGLAERGERTQPDEADDWICHLATFMGDGIKTRKAWERENLVRFVTFNFDRILEDELRKNALGLYQDGEPQLQPIVHVHGQLPPLDHDHLYRGWLDLASSHVKVIEDEIGPEVKGPAQEALAWADVVCFLGFSYQDENLATLDWAALAKNKDIFGSGHGLTAAQRIQVSRKTGISSGRLGGATEGCRQFLENQDILR